VIPRLTTSRASSPRASISASRARAARVPALFAPALAPPAAAAPWETTAQLPKPAEVTNWTRHLSLEAPPVHFVPAGRLATIGCEPVVAGAASPFVVTVIATKLFPVPVASTLAVTLREPSAPPLKLVAVKLRAPPVAATAVDESRVAAMLTPAPHGLAAFGRLTSFLARVPATPRAGETPACALTWLKRPRMRTEEVKILENIFGRRRELARVIK